MAYAWEEEFLHPEREDVSAMQTRTRVEEGDVLYYSVVDKTVYTEPDAPKCCAVGENHANRRISPQSVLLILLVILFSAGMTQPVSAAGS